jgi:hypothetical protein
VGLVDGDEREDEEFIAVGSERLALFAARLRQRRIVRVLALPVAAAVLAGGVWLGIAAQADHRHAAGPQISPSRTAPRPTVAPEPSRQDLYTVTPKDLAAVLAEPRCRTRCVANNLEGAALSRATAAFAGMTPLVGGTVTGRGGAVILQSIEALAQPDAIVHLVLRRVGPRPAGGATVTDRLSDGSRTVVVSQVRADWRITATIVVRGSEPPVIAARIWTTTTPLPA